MSTEPEKMLLQARGSEIRKNDFQAEAPKVLATFSNLTSTALKPSLAASIRKGTLTNIMAMTTPVKDLKKPMPMPFKILPKRKLLPKTNRRAIPAAE